MSDNLNALDPVSVLLKQKSALQERLKQNPKDYTAMYSLALRHYALKEFISCSKMCHILADLGAGQIEVYQTGSKADLASGYYKQSEKIIRQGLKKFPDNSDLYMHLATALHNLRRYKESEDAHKKAVELSPDKEDSYIALGKHYTSTGQLKEGIEVLQEGLKSFPNSIGLWNNLGAAYTRLDMYLKASECYIKALRIQPEKVDVLVNIGITMERLKNAHVGQQFYEEALKIDPEHGFALCMKAASMGSGGLAQEAMPYFEKGLDRLMNTPGGAEALSSNYSNYVFYQHYVPYRSMQTIHDAIHKFYELSCSDIIEKPALEFENNTSKTRKLKIGLLSKGFNVHPVGQMIYAALKNIDRSQYELFCYTELNVHQRDELTDLIYDTVDHVVRVNNIMNHEVVEQMRAEGIDILVEMTGHSEGGRRMPLIVERAAPVQVKWVGGLFNTTGLPQMDWLLTDHIETPEGVDHWYTEKLYRMPDDYIVYYPPPYAPKVQELPALNNKYVTFGNLNNLAKTNSYSIEIWSKIMHKVPNSRLLLKGHKMHEQIVQDHIRAAFAKHDIAGDRIIVEGGEPHEKFMDVYNRFDIALDPHPYTGGLTTCEALWMGVPVITLPGETFAGRHAATHLTNAGMPEFIAKDEQDYIDIAVKWANDLEGLAKLRAGMRDHVAATPLVDGPRFARNFEIALRHMWSEWCDQKLAAAAGAKNTKKSGNAKNQGKKRKK